MRAVFFLGGGVQVLFRKGCDPLSLSVGCSGSRV